MTVDVTKLKCNFVNEVLKYINCGKYSIDCCYDKAYAALLAYKLAIFTDCDLDVDALCYLSEFPATDYVQDCDDAFSLLDCDTQISLSLAKLVQSCLITSVLSNPDTGSQYPKIVVANNDSYPEATINVVTTSSCGGSNTTAITSGCQPDGNGDLQCDEEFNPHARIRISIPPQYVPTSTLKRIWIGYTANPTTLNNLLELDISPSTSPYLVCTGCVTVDPNELEFGDPNFATAATNVLRNAMHILFGDADLGDFRVNKTVLGEPIIISSLVKHNPSSTWTGLAKFKSRVEWIWDGAFQTAETSPLNTQLTVYEQFAQNEYEVPLLDCTDATLVVQGMAAMNVNSNATDMHQLVLNSSNNLYPWTINSVSNWICPKTTLTATVDALTNVSSTEWRDPDDDFISEDFSIVVEDTGVYTFNIELENGCSASETITV